MGAREPEMTEGLYRAEHGVCIYSYKNYVPFVAGNRMNKGFGEYDHVMRPNNYF